MKGGWNRQIQFLWKGTHSDRRPCSWWDKIPSISGELDSQIENSAIISSAGFHGLSVPILQPASVDAQLCRAFWVRFLLDWGAVQTRGSPGAPRMRHIFCSQYCLSRTWSTRYCDRQGAMRGLEVGAQVILLTSPTDRRTILYTTIHKTGGEGTCFPFVREHCPLGII